MVYELANDPYVDPATGVMRNRHGIRDMATLARIEQNYATLMATRIMQEWRPDHRADRLTAREAGDGAATQQGAPQSLLRW